MQPGPDFEACRRDTLIGSAGLMLWVVATFVVSGGDRWRAFVMDRLCTAFDFSWLL